MKVSEDKRNGEISTVKTRRSPRWYSFGCMNAVISDAVAILRECRNASDGEILCRLLAAGVERIVKADGNRSNAHSIPMAGRRIHTLTLASRAFNLEEI
jgi:hypothetical protein